MKVRLLIDDKGEWQTLYIEDKKIVEKHSFTGSEMLRYLTMHGVLHFNDVSVEMVDLVE